MAKVEIGNGTRQVEVTPEGSLYVAASPFPPFVTQLTRPLRQYFTLGGTPTGDNDLGQDGSVTNLDFCIPADPNDDMYIKHISFLVGYGGAAFPYEFGDGAALTNGVQIFYDSQSGATDIHDGIKSNQDLFRLSATPVNSTWELRGVGAANDYGYFVEAGLTQFSPEYGVKLDAGSNQKMVIRIRDTMTAVSGAGDSFNAIAHGFYRFN